MDDLLPGGERAESLFFDGMAAERRAVWAALKAERDAFAEEVVQLRRKVRTVETLRAMDRNVPKWTSPKRAPKGLVGVPVVLISDTHFGETVDAATMNGWNEYNDDIANRRFERVVNQIPDMLGRHAAGYSFPYLVVALMGDLVSGSIHKELERTNGMSVPRVIETWVPRLTAGLLHLADETGVERVVVPCVDGNHDRLDLKPVMKRRAEESFTWVIYQWIADKLRDDDRFTFIISQSSDVRLPIYSTDFLFVHGDGARGGGGIGGIWPPIMRYVHKLKTQYSTQHEPIDHVCMGHWHTYVKGDGWTVNGSLKGPDEYTRRLALRPEPASQALMLVSPDRGIILDAPVFAD